MSDLEYLSRRAIIEVEFRWSVFQANFTYARKVAQLYLAGWLVKLAWKISPDLCRTMGYYGDE